MLRFLIKLVITLGVIIFCTQIGRKLPSLAGLIAVMPLTGLIVLLWLYTDNPGDFNLISEYTKGAVWGILPSVLFFLTAWACFHKHLPLWITLSASFAIWSIAAFCHQWLLNR